VERLKQWYETLSERRFGWAIRGVAAAAIGRNVEPADAEWVLDRYFSGDALVRWSWRSAFQRLPWSLVSGRVDTALESSDEDLRRAALILVNLCSPTNAREYFVALTQDPDERVRTMARFQLDRVWPDPNAT